MMAMLSMVHTIQMVMKSAVTCLTTVEEKHMRMMKESHLTATG